MNQPQSLFVKAPTLVATVTTSGTSTAAARVHPTNTGRLQVCLTSTANTCHVLFGKSNVAAATVTNAFPIVPGFLYQFEISSDSEYFRVIQGAGGAGTLAIYIPGHSPA